MTRMRFCLALGLGLGLLGCESLTVEQVRRDLGLAGRVAEASVSDVRARDRYLGFSLTSRVHSGDLYVVNTPKCRAILESAALRFDVGSGEGAILADGESCEIIGIGSLPTRRDSRPRPDVRERTRRRVSFDVVYRDEEVALVRGDFELAGLLYWPSARDTIAVIPIRPECTPLLERGYAPSEWRQIGPYPVVLIGEEGNCPVEGLIVPQR